MNLWFNIGKQMTVDRFRQQLYINFWIKTANHFWNLIDEDLGTRIWDTHSEYTYPAYTMVVK